MDDGDAADELGEALLELLAVVVAGGLADLAADLLDPGLDGLAAAVAVDHGGAVLGDHDAAGGAEVVDADLLELDAQVVHDCATAREHGDVFEHGLAALAEAGSLDGHDVHVAAQLVDHQGGQGVAVDVLSEDEHGLAGLVHLLEHRQQILHAADLLLVHQHECILEDGLHAVGIGHEVGAEVAAVELHALDDLELGLQALGLLDRDDAFLADLVHGAGQDLADLGVAIGADGADLGHLGGVLGGPAHVLELSDDGLDGPVDAALEVHGVGPGHDHLGTVLVDGLGQHGGGGGSVAGDVRGLGCDLLDHLGADVLELVGELDLLGDRHAVLGDDGGAKALVEHHVAALGA